MTPTTRAGAIFLVILAIQILSIFLVESGMVAFSPTWVDRIIGACLTLVLLFACVGLFRGWRSGWIAGLVFVYGSILDTLRSSALDEGFGFPTIFAAGVLIAILAVPLWVLDSEPLRKALAPEPPVMKVPWKGIAQVGLAAAAVSLVGSIWGFLILGVWASLMFWSKRRRKSH